MRKKHIVAVFVAVVACLILYFIVSLKSPSLKNSIQIERNPVIFPDYTQIVIPPNIAPLNFIVKEEGTGYLVKIYSKNGDTIRIVNNNPLINIPIKRWKKLINGNRNENLIIDVYVRNQNGTWNSYKNIINKIANEEIDVFLAYRLINPGYRLWGNLGLYIRNIQTFDEDPIIVNNMAENNCMNCHSFCQNNPDRALFQVRGKIGGTVIIEDGVIKKLNTETKNTLSAAVYPAWHPNGKLIAFSVNKIVQEFYSAGPKSINVFDTASDIIVYNSKSNIVTTSPKISKKDYENMPAWSPDGKYLYYCSAPQPIANHSAKDSLKYSLLRISYDEKRNEWGEVDTVVSSEKTGLSISWPRISPDGRFVMFCMTDYGYFTVYNPGSDLYLLDLNTGEHRSLSCNSNDVESYHSWSSNCRWFVFSSKRLDGLCSRPYFSYFDKDGKIYKSFIMPQKDPRFYDTFLKNFNIPELLTSRWSVSKWNLYKTIHGKATNVEFDTTVDVDALSGATSVNTNSR
jgi:tricorn protease-like protein